MFSKPITIWYLTEPWNVTSFSVWRIDARKCSCQVILQYWWYFYLWNFVKLLNRYWWSIMKMQSSLGTPPRVRKHTKVQSNLTISYVSYSSVEHLWYTWLILCIRFPHHCKNNLIIQQASFCRYLSSINNQFRKLVYHWDTFSCSPKLLKCREIL